MEQQSRLPSNVPSRGPGRGGLFFAILALVAVASVGVLVMQGWRPGERSPDPVYVTDAALRAAYSESPQIAAWLKTWQGAGAHVDIGEFALRERASMPTSQLDTMATRPDSEALESPTTDRYLWSPDRTRWVDYLASYGEPDSSLLLFNRGNDGLLERLAYCGTPCGFDDVTWVDDARFLVIGTEEAFGDQANACGPTTAQLDDVSVIGCRVLTLRLYDLGSNELSTYVSSPRLLTVNPFESAKQARWEASQPKGEQPVKNVTIVQPREGDVVPAQFVISGQARTFEQNVRVRIVNLRTSRVLVDSFTTATAPDIGIFGPYAYDVSLPAEHVQKGDELLVEAFENSAEDGREINLVSRTVQYQP